MRLAIAVLILLLAGTANATDNGMLLGIAGGGNGGGGGGIALVVGPLGILSPGDPL